MLRRSTANGIRKWAYCYSILIVFLASRSLALITANENETVSRRSSSTTVANESEKMMTASSSKTNSQMITSAVVNENSNFTDTTNRLHLEENILKSVINNNQFIINDENNNQLYYSSGEDDDILNNAETSILSTLSPSMSNTASISSSDSNSGNGGGGGDDDDKKTLSQQVVDGKYGLIQKELFSVKTRRPGIISYDINPEVPKDNINNLGGLEPDDIWLAENHLLVLAGGSKVKDASSPWIPIDNYIAPGRQIILPERPKIPPPFPVQLTDNGPIEYLKGENGSTAPPPVIPFFLMFPPPPPPQTNNNQGRIPQYHLNRNPASPPINTLIPLRPSSNYTPSYGPPPSSFIRPLYPTTTTGNLSLSPPLSPSLYKPPPGSEFIPPFGNISSDSFDEDDPSLYYPPPYDFYYPTDNTTNVPPGPLVPGIVLPPPPNFFSIQHGKTTSDRKPAKLGAHQRSKLSKILPNKPVNVKTGSDKSVSLEFSTPIRYQDILNDVAYPDLGENKIMYNNNDIVNGRQNEQEQWVPIPAPKPYYITGGPKNTLIKNTVTIMGGTLPTTTTTSNKQEPATIPDEGYSYENPPTDNGGGYVLDDNNKDNKKEFYTTAKPFYTVTSAKMYHPPIKTVPVEDKSVQKIYYFYEEPNKHITTNVNNNKVQDITKNYFDTHYSNGYHHYRHNEYTTTPTSFLYHNDIVPTTPLPGSSTTPVSSSKDSYNNNKKLNANKKANNRYENNQRQPKTAAAVITGPPILPIYYLAELDNLNLPDYHPAVAPHHNYDYNKVSASPPVNYQYSNVANPQEASIYTNNNFLQQQPHPTPRPIFEYSYTATGYRQNEGNNIINRPGENRNPYETEQISSNQQQPYQIKYHQTNDQYSLYQPKNKPLKNSNHQHPSNQPQTYWIDNTPTYTGGNLYNIRLASVSPPKQQQQQNGYFEYNNEPYEPNKSNPPYYVPLKHPPQSWNDNNNNNNNKWNQEENHSASGVGGKTAPAFYQTENPFYAFFTKDDEQFIDDNTKKYFTFFGQKIRKPEDTTVQVPASTIAISTNTASKKNPAHNNRQYASYHPVTTIEYNNEWGTTPLPPGKETGIDENESVTVSLEGDTLVNYIKPPITNEPEAELISGNLVTYSPSSSSSNKPYKEIVEDSSYFSSSTSAAINRNNRYREPLIEHSSEEYGQIGGTTTFKPISLEGDTDVNYKQNRPPINPDAEYISHRNHPDTKPRRTRIKTTSNNGGGRPYRQKPISLESDIAVNYRSHRPASNPNAEFIYQTPQRLNNWRGEQQRNRQQQHTAEGSQRMVSYRLPNSNEHLYFLTPKQIYKLEDLKNGGGNQRARKYEQLENENYDFQSDAEKSSNYLKRMMPSFFSSNNTATINTTTNTSSITNISDG